MCELKGMINMKFILPIIVVKDIQKSKKFYEEVLRQNITLDLDSNITFSDKFAIQADYADLVDADNFHISFNSNDHELYFEENDFDELLKHLEKFSDIHFIHKTKTYPWLQRVIRFYDPDFHIIEIGESMDTIFKNLYNLGMTIDEISEKTCHPIEYIKKSLDL